jgi:molecular chaperone GrpE
MSGGGNGDQSEYTEAGEDEPFGSEPEEAEPEAGPEGSALEDAAARFKAEAETLREQLLRALADAENQRKRFQREREDLNKYAIANFARDLVTVADNLERALASLPTEAGADSAQDLASVAEGIALTGRELAVVLDRHGIVKIEPLGQPFDHNRHEALFEVDGTGQAPGTVVQVIQPGYVIHDRLLRPARVGVAKRAGGEPPKVDTVA